MEGIQTKQKGNEMKDRYYLYVWHTVQNGQYAYAYCRPYDTIGECRKVIEKLIRDDFWTYDWSVWDRKERHYIKFNEK